MKVIFTDFFGENGRFLNECALEQTRGKLMCLFLRKLATPVTSWHISLEL